MNRVKLLGLISASLFLTSCTLGPDYRQPEFVLPDSWQAPLPHAGSTERLGNWWSQFQDPLLVELIREAEQNNPTLEQAIARIEQSRANIAAARSALFPNLDANASDQSSGGSQLPKQRLDRAQLTSAWELDLFGGNRRGQEAAEARQESARAAWHDARVSLAAEVAQEYIGLRSCEALLADSEADQASRRLTEQLTEQKTRAGFASPSDTSLAQASSAEAATRVIAQRAECDISIKALVALTGEAEPQLREKLRPSSGKLPVPTQIHVATLPVQAINHRPDLIAAERDLAAANAEIGGAIAARYPRLSLSGSIGLQNLRIDGISQQSSLWGFGPSLELPLFDAGRRAANVDAARARYAEALATYKQKVRQAVREVEQSLVRLDSSTRSSTETARSAQGYDVAFKAAETRWRTGLSSQLELEETRRLAINARTQHLQTQREQVSAWISLYRAVGGEWDKPISTDATD